MLNMVKDTHVALRLPTAVRDGLKKYADADGRTLSGLMAKILNEWLADQQEKEKAAKSKR